MDVVRELQACSSPKARVWQKMASYRVPVPPQQIVGFHLPWFGSVELFHIAHFTTYHLQETNCYIKVMVELFSMSKFNRLWGHKFQSSFKNLRSKVFFVMFCKVSSLPTCFTLFSSRLRCRWQVGIKCSTKLPLFYKRWLQLSVLVDCEVAVTSRNEVRHTVNKQLWHINDFCFASHSFGCEKMPDFEGSNRQLLELSISFFYTGKTAAERNDKAKLLKETVFEVRQCAVNGLFATKQCEFNVDDCFCEESSKHFKKVNWTPSFGKNRANRNGSLLQK